MTARLDLTQPHHRVVTRDADYADAVWDTYATRAEAALAWARAITDPLRDVEVLDVFHQLDAATGEDEIVAKFANGFVTLETCSCGGEECGDAGAGEDDDDDPLGLAAEARVETIVLPAEEG